MMHLRYLQIFYIFKIKKIGNHQKKLINCPLLSKTWCHGLLIALMFKKKKSGWLFTVVTPTPAIHQAHTLNQPAKKQTLFNWFKKKSGHLTKDEVISFREWILFSRNLWKYPPTYPIKGHFWVDDFPNLPSGRIICDRSLEGTHHLIILSRGHLGVKSLPPGSNAQHIQDDDP